MTRDMLEANLEVQLGLSPDEIARLMAANGETMCAEAWYRLESQKMKGDIDDEQRYYLGILNSLRGEAQRDDALGVGAVHPDRDRIDAAAAAAAQAQTLIGIWQSKLLETVSDQMRVDQQAFEYRHDVLKSLRVTAVDETTVLVEAPEKHHPSLYRHFGPLCMGKELHLIDTDTGTAQAYETERIRQPPLFSRDQLQKRAHASPRRRKRYPPRRPGGKPV